ncbi:MAG: AAA family ATPase [Candidatus Korobacteraceae bacterium]
MSTIDELKQQKRWVCWKLTKVSGRDKPTKVPYMPSGRKAESDDPATWSTYAECKAVVSQFSGIGCVLGDGVFGVDIDACCDAVTGKFTPESREIVIALDTYTEYSYSGDGCHLLGIGDLDEKYRKNKRKVIVKAVPGCKQIEIKSAGFYFVYTGRHIGKTPSDLMSRQAQLDTLCAKVAAVTKTGIADGLRVTMSVSEEERFKMLMAGDMSLYEDNHSTADFALCILLAKKHGCNAFKVDAEFRTSELYRDKWERDDYRENTITRACTAVAKDAPVTFDDTEPMNEDTPPEWVIEPLAGREEGWFPSGEVSLVGGPSGAGKTHALLRIAEAARHGAQTFGHLTTKREYGILLHDRGSASMRRTCKAAKLPIDDVMTHVIRLSREQQKAPPAEVVEAAIQMRPNVKLWILEGLDFWTPELHKLDVVGNILDELQRVAARYKVAVVGTLGSPKQKENDRYASGRDQFMGSVAFGRKSETCISISRTADSRVRQMNVYTRNTADEEFFFTWGANGLELTTEPVKPNGKMAEESALGRMEAAVFTATAEGAELRYDKAFGPSATFFRWRRVAQAEGKVTLSSKKYYRALGYVARSGVIARPCGG